MLPIRNIILANTITKDDVEMNIYLIYLITAKIISSKDFHPGVPETINIVRTEWHEHTDKKPQEKNPPSLAIIKKLPPAGKLSFTSSLLSDASCSTYMLYDIKHFITLKAIIVV